MFFLFLKYIDEPQVLYCRRRYCKRRSWATQCSL